jgi:8-oxo-dGTP diphosphatase
MSDETDWKFNVLSGAATVHQGAFLLLRRSVRESFLPDVWGIPAGQVHRDEDPRVACVRELREETGLDGQVVDQMGYSRFTSRRGAIELNNIQLNFLVVVPAEDVQLNPSSHSAFTWISLDDIYSGFLDDFTRTIMTSARQLWKEYRDPAESRQHIT